MMHVKSRYLSASLCRMRKKRVARFESKYKVAVNDIQKWAFLSMADCILYICGGTDMCRLTTAIRSEMYVVRRFRRCANVIQ